jgi:hypothetical protein
LTLGELHQDQLDAWRVAGASTRRLIKPFIDWLAQPGTTAPLNARWNIHATINPPLDDHQRLAILASCSPTSSPSGLICSHFPNAGGGTRTPDTRIMIPLL